MSVYKHGIIALLALGLLPGCATGRDVEPLEVRISGLVDAMTRSERAERAAFEELESLGSQAVPYMVGHLKDMRPLAARSIRFTNKAPDAFEGERHYSPATVHDAIAAILNHVTGEHFVFVYNGATDQERENNRNKWTEWCRAAFPSQAETCNGK